MKKRVWDFLPAIVAAVLSAGVITVFRACAEGEEGWMSCHFAQMDVFYVGIVLVVLSVLGGLLRQKKTRLAFDLLSILGGVFAIFIPGTFVGLCMMDTMRCHTLMKPFVTVAAVLFLVTVAIKLVLDLMRKESRAEK